MSSRLESYFRDYDSYHRTVGNELCHYIGIPLILISTLGLLASIPLTVEPFFGSPLFRIDAGSVVWVAASLWYLVLSWRLGLSFSFVALAGYFIGRIIPVSWLWVLFVLGWIFQGVGHAVYEKRSPAFFRNLTHVLIGPLWIFARVTGLRRDSGRGRA